MRPRLLDLFCGAGGAAVGYSRAGFDVTGVDIAPQPRYPFDFIQDDALEWLERNGGSDIWGPFAAVHASPPCQAYSSITPIRGVAAEHPDLIEPTRALLRATGLPYVIENVVRAPLSEPVLVCAVALGLRIPEGILRRHRLFESNVALLTPGCGCHRGDGRTLGVYGGGTRQHTRRNQPAYKGGTTDKANRDQARQLMEMPWATRTEMNQAIPPAYTELIGHQLMQHVRAEAAA